MSTQTTTDRLTLAGFLLGGFVLGGMIGAVGNANARDVRSTDAATRQADALEDVAREFRNLRRDCK